jgi:hypothetical protein
VVVDKKSLCPWFLKAADVLARYRGIHPELRVSTRGLKWANHHQTGTCGRAE